MPTSCSWYFHSFILFKSCNLLPLQVNEGKYATAISIFDQVICFGMSACINLIIFCHLGIYLHGPFFCFQRVGGCGKVGTNPRTLGPFLKFVWTFCDFFGTFYTQILKEDPTYPEALIGRGTARAFKRELGSAIADFSKVSNFSALQAYERIPALIYNWLYDLWLRL